ncbi:hypothetical protein BH10BAC2_BH10BAC2_41040 [soil metagenome]
MIVLNIQYFDIYFLCIDAKKVTKKNQGQHDRSAHLSGPAPHIVFLIKFDYYTVKNRIFSVK